MIVTIDGPAGAGKSSVARALAERLGFQFLDTGATYRAVAWKCLQEGVDIQNAAQAARVASSIQIRLEGNRVFVDNIDVTEAIRSPEVSSAASVVAAHEGVRTKLVDLQRRLAAGRNIVTEGRDQGTVVFPNAECKFFLTASAEERARRRLRDLQKAGHSESSFKQVLADIQERDARDAQRAVSPLRPAPDAVVVDTTHLTQQQVIEQLWQHVKNKQASTK